MHALKAEIRSPQAKAKQLRRSGLLPCNIYGTQLPESLSIQVDQQETENLLRQIGVGSKLEIHLNGEKKVVLIKEISRDSLKNKVEHIEFQALAADIKVNSSAKIILTNRDVVVGFVSQLMFEVPYSALPVDLVDTITIDLKEVPVGSRLAVKDLALAQDEKIQLLVDEDSAVLSVEENKRATAKGGETSDAE